MKINSLALQLLSMPIIVATNVKTITGIGLLLSLHSTEATITDGLLRLYRGDGDASDATGNSPPLNGEAGYTDVTFPQSGTSRKVFDFQNTQNGLLGSASGLPSGSSSRSMLGWFKFKGGLGTNGGQDPFGYGRHVNNENWYIDVYPSGGQYRVTLDVHSNDEGINPILDTTASTWFHLALTYDQSSNVNTAYLNGVSHKTGTPSVVPNTNVDATSASPPSKLFIGHANWDHGSTGLGAYKGQVADVAFFNRVITADEVATIYGNDNWYLNAGGGGDPHLVGFGGKMFTWQGACDVLLLTTASNESNKDDELHVHIRTRRVRQWSAIDAVAIKAGRDVVEIDSTDGKVFWNGNEVTAINTQTMSLNNPTIKRKRVLYNFILDGNKYVDVTANKKTKMIYLSLTGNFPNQTRGLLGSPANPGFFGRNGLAMKGDVNSFVEQWQINDNDPQLFRTRPFPQFPDKCSYTTKRVKSKISVKDRRLKEQKMVSLEEATAACANHTPGPLKQFCIEDVFQTGDMQVVEEKFYG